METNPYQAPDDCGPSRPTPQSGKVVVLVMLAAGIAAAIASAFASFH